MFVNGGNWLLIPGTGGYVQFVPRLDVNQKMPEEEEEMEHIYNSEASSNK